MNVIGAKYVRVIGIMPFGMLNRENYQQQITEMKCKLGSTNRTPSLHDIPSDQWKLHRTTPMWKFRAMPGSYVDKGSVFIENPNFNSEFQGASQAKLWSIVGPGSYLNVIIEGSSVGPYEDSNAYMDGARIFNSYAGKNYHAFGDVRSSFLGDDNVLSKGSFITNTITGNEVSIGHNVTINGAIIGKGVIVNPGVIINGKGSLDFRWEEGELRVHYNPDEMIIIPDGTEIGPGVILDRTPEIRENMTIYIQQSHGYGVKVK